VCSRELSKLAEWRLVRAYLALFLAPVDDHGTKTVLLARHGSYDVRLVEFAQELSDDVPLLWLELHAHDAQCSLDSCGCYDFDEAVIAVERFISQARALNRRPMGA
jgi:hypothetical protein